MSKSDLKVLAAFQPEPDVPIGTVFDLMEPDQSVEEKFFRGWQPALTTPTWWGRDRHYVIALDPAIGKKVLHHQFKRDNVLLTGEEDWINLTFKLRARQLIAVSSGSPDDENVVVARTGIVVRQLTTRRYYYFCMESLARFVLYRRRDEDYTVLGECAGKIDRERYYDLCVEVKGTRVRCSVDGRLAIDVHDPAYSRGKCGIRSNTFDFVESSSAAMSEEDERAFKEPRTVRLAAAAQAGKTLPKPALWKEFDLPPGYLLDVTRPGQQAFTSRESRNGEPPSPATVFYVETKRDLTNIRAGNSGGDPCVIRAMTVDGQVLWRHEGFGTPDRLSHVVFADFSGAGAVDAAAVLSDRVVILDGKTGRVRHECDLPSGESFQSYRHEKTSIAKPHVMQFRPRPAPPGLILREDCAAGGSLIWAYDAQLKPLWDAHVSRPKFGHTPWFFDVDGDGCDEVLLGYHLFDQDGKVIWQMEDSIYADRLLGAMHADSVFIGKLHGEDSDRITSIHAGGSEGLFYTEGRTGKIRVHHALGHVQYVSPGRFRPDLPGLQVCASTRWGNFGIMTILDSEGRELCQWQPDYEGEACTPIRWTTEQDLIAITRSAASKGLWDGWGRKVVELPEDVIPGRNVGQFVVADVCGDERDEIISCSVGKLRIYTQER